MAKRFVKSGFLIVMAAVLYLIAANSGAGWMYVVAAALVATILVSVPAPLLNLRGLTVTRRAPVVGVAGRPLDCKTEVHNEGRFAKQLLEIGDEFAGGAGDAVVARIGGRTSEDLGYEIENPQRGIYSGGEILLESGAPFGLFYGRRRIRVLSNTVIYPRTFQVSGLPEPLASETETLDWEGVGNLRQGSGGEFWGVRDYRPGDPAKLVAWRQSARNLSTGRLAVREMAQETLPPLSLSIDLDRRAPREVREMQISAAASLMLQALKEGRKVTADAGPQRRNFPEEPFPDSILTWCAGLKHSRSPEPGAASVGIVPSLKNARTFGAGTIVFVSCSAFAGTGPWMTLEEEKQFIESMKSSGRRVSALGPDVQEPWRVA